MRFRSALSVAGVLLALGCDASSDDGNSMGGAGGMSQDGAGGTGGGGSAGKGGTTGGTAGTAGSGGTAGGAGSAGTGGMAGAPSGADCRVDDIVYPNGATGIPDPFSCNECSCNNGALGCTKMSCPIACPAGTAPGISCDSCGPADGCEVVFHGCLESCVSSTDCAMGSCSENVCRNLCG